jgi:hypothetical protein
MIANLFISAAARAAQRNTVFAGHSGTRCRRLSAYIRCRSGLILPAPARLIEVKIRCRESARTRAAGCNRRRLRPNARVRYHARGAGSGLIQDLLVLRNAGND